MGNRETHIKNYIDNANNGSKRVITYEIVGHLLDTNTANGLTVGCRVALRPRHHLFLQDCELHSK